MHSHECIILFVPISFFCLKCSVSAKHLERCLSFFNRIKHQPIRSQSYLLHVTELYPSLDDPLTLKLIACPSNSIEEFSVHVICVRALRAVFARANSPQSAYIALSLSHQPLRSEYQGKKSWIMRSISTLYQVTVWIWTAIFSKYSTWMEKTTQKQKGDCVP